MLFALIVVRAVGNPSGRLPVVFQTGRRLELVLVGVHGQTDLIVLVGLLDRVELDGDVFFAGAEEAADADDQGIDLAFGIDQHVLDVADLVVLGVVDALLVPVGDGDALRGNAGHHFTGGKGSRGGDG